MVDTVAKARSGPMTEAEFLAIEKDGFKYEFVNGEAIRMPTGMRHDELVAWLISLLMPFARGLGRIIGPDAGYRMVGGNIRCPDVSFVRKDRFPDGKVPNTFGDFAPDLCVEVLSASETGAAVFTKLGEYFASGAGLVWLVDPERERVSVYRSELDIAVYGREDTLTGEDILPGFECKVREVFDTV